MKKKIAIISENDRVWAFSAWQKALPLLKEKYVIEAFWLCPATLSNKKGLRVIFWYFKTFSFIEFSLLVLFKLIAEIKILISVTFGKSSFDFKDMAKKEDIDLFTCKHPNEEQFVSWLKERNIDILLIAVGTKLKKQVLDAPKIGTINKHASALPANRGLLPYIWAVIKKTPQGISYHSVDKNFDEGDLLFQTFDIPEKNKKSLISFYSFVFGHYPEGILNSIETIIQKKKLKMKSGLKPSYQGLPLPTDIIKFKKNGGKIIRLLDLKEALKL